MKTKITELPPHENTPSTSYMDPQKMPHSSPVAASRVWDTGLIWCVQSFPNRYFFPKNSRKTSLIQDMGASCELVIWNVKNRSPTIHRKGNLHYNDVISKKTSKLRVAGLCAGNSPRTGEFPAQKASNAENVSIWWRHHGLLLCHSGVTWASWRLKITNNSTLCTIKRTSKI